MACSCSWIRPTEISSEFDFGIDFLFYQDLSFFFSLSSKILLIERVSE